MVLAVSISTDTAIIMVGVALLSMLASGVSIFVSLYVRSVVAPLVEAKQTHAAAIRDLWTEYTRLRDRHTEHAERLSRLEGGETQ